MRVLLIAVVLLVALPVVAQDVKTVIPGEKGRLFVTDSLGNVREVGGGSAKCTHADLLEALRRARKWLPANEEIASPAIGHLPRTAAQRLREQADDLEYVDAVLKECRE